MDLHERKSRLRQSKANNLGFKESKGEHVLILNPDILAEGETIVDSLNHFKNKENENFGILACQLTYPDGKKQESRTFKSSPIVEELNQNLFLQKLGFHLGKEKNQGEIVAIMGSYLLFNRTLITKINYLFDEDFFMYSEEFELCARIRKAGLKIGYLEGESVVHIGGATVTDSVWSRKQKLISQFLYIFKSKGTFQFLMVFGLKKLNLFTLIITYFFIKTSNKEKAKIQISDFFKLYFQILSILLLNFRIHKSFRVKA